MNDVCTEVGCTRAARTRGLCTKHYAQRGTCQDCGGPCGVKAARCRPCSCVARKGMAARNGQSGLDTDEFGTLAVCGYKGRCTWRGLYGTEAQAQHALKTHRDTAHYSRSRNKRVRGGQDFEAVNARLTAWLKARGLSTSGQAD